jgi:integrase
MPNAKNSPSRIPSYRHHKPSGKAVVTIDGRDIYLGDHDTPASRDEYDRLIAEWLTRRRAGISYASDQTNSDLTVDELLAEYLIFAKTYYVSGGKLTGEYENLKLAMKPLQALYGCEFVRDFGPLRLKAVRQAMIDSDLCRNQVNDRVNRIRRIFKWGVENQLVAPDILHALQAVSPLRRGRSTARESSPIRPVPEKHIEAVLKIAPPTVAAMIQVQWLTGMRPGELVIMRGCDIDMTGDDWLYRPVKHKTQHFGIERVIALGPKAQEILTGFLKPDVQAFIFSPRDAMRQRYASRPTHRSKPNRERKTQRRIRNFYTTNTYARAISYACDEAGVSKWSPNRLRHSAATRLRKEFGLDVAQAVLGHKTAEVTQVYAELDRGKAIEAMRRSG